jgi:XTP/dITP diphosphohydrolase
MRLLLATTNTNKVREIRPILANLPIEIVTLGDLPPIPEPEETANTFWENARIKALGYASASGLTVVAEDSGLVTDVLGGEPGVQSARFLGHGVPYETRFAEIYRRMEASPRKTRHARFVTALCLAHGDEILYETETTIEGAIASEPAGTQGFGYDPIFYYPLLDKTTGELTIEEKTWVSHRARAFRDLARWYADHHQDHEAHEENEGARRIVLEKQKNFVRPSPFS